MYNEEEILVVLAVVLSLNVVNAEISKEDWLVGGSFSLNSTSDTTVSLNPAAGYFKVNNLALGGDV
ncbi:hypothetical protein [Flavihumibacter fluvii]|uniref:hypothetical protein n=1 Tax=Flavihumibacter fluvii TaxID=2838157 RepID=UPI001BDF5548|nr:hypothetical protein [Flavihumibacter fluvii]ULQ53491.1 hypothetical protein KJS93_04045 [Flavihumibacter fluvii]